MGVSLLQEGAMSSLILRKGEDIKGRAYRIAKEMVPKLGYWKYPAKQKDSPIMHPDLQAIQILPLESDLYDKYINGEANNIRVARDKPFQSEFGRNNNISEGQDFIMSLLRQLRNFDLDLYAVEYASYKVIEEDLLGNQYIGSFDPWKWLARPLLTDPSFQFCHAYPDKFPGLPGVRPYYFYQQIERKNKGASVGFPFFQRWEDSTRSVSENVLLQRRVLGDAKYFSSDLKELIESQRIKGFNLDLACNMADEMSSRYFMPWIGHKRNLGDRLVTGASNVISYEVWRHAQPLTRAMSVLKWYFGSGNLAVKLHKAADFLGSKVGTALVWGDDGAVKCPGFILNIDATSFDVLVRSRERARWYFAMWRVYVKNMGLKAGSLQFYMYCVAEETLFRQPILTPLGHLILPWWAGIRSGSPTTSCMGSAIEYARLISCDWSDPVRGLAQLNTMGHYRREKQLPLETIVTIGQLVVSSQRKNLIHGLISRIVHHMYEGENPYRATTWIEHMAPIVSRLMYIIEYPFKLGEIVTEFVAQRIVKYLKRLSARDKVNLWIAIGEERKSRGLTVGQIERRQLNRVWKVLISQRWRNF